MDNHKGKFKEMKKELFPPFHWLSLIRIICQQLVGFVHTNLMFITTMGFISVLPVGCLLVILFLLGFR
jgi:hypothetical protein